MSYSAYIYFFFHLIEYPTIAKLCSYDSISSYKNESSRIYRYINTINIIFVSFWFTIQVFHSGTQWWRFRISRETIRIGLFGQKQGGEGGRGRERKRKRRKGGGGGKRWNCQECGTIHVAFSTIEYRDPTFWPGFKATLWRKSPTSPTATAIIIRRRIAFVIRDCRSEESSKNSADILQRFSFFYIM